MLGAKIIDGVVYPCDGGNIFNLTFVDNILEFDFLGYEHGSDLNKGYVKITGQSMSVGDEVYFDDFTITEINNPAVFNMDFEDKEAGTNAHATANIWNGYGQSITFQESDGNKYLNYVNTASGQDWPAFYFNNLPVTSGVEYKLELDIISANFERMYLCYPDSQQEEYEYSRNEFVGKSANTPSMGETTFDGNHLSLIFTPTNTKGDYWAQIKIVLYHNASTLDVKIDNVKITPTTSLVSAKSITSDVAEKELCVGKDIDVSDLEFTLTRNDDSSRLLAADEYVVDRSQVNKDVVGEYPVTVKVVDELGNEVSTTITVKYVVHVEVVDAAVPATCTEKGKTEGKHCSVCGEVTVTQTEVPANGHTEVTDEEVPPTCTEAGKTAGKHCSECDEVTVPQTEIPAKGHIDEDSNYECDTCKTELPHEENDKGCGGSIVASIFSVLALAGSVAILNKKREEN